MNKKILGLAVSALFIATAAHAADTSATLNIAGSVTNSFKTTASCTAVVSQNSINLTSDISNLRQQGVDYQPVANVELSMTGDSGCAELMSKGRIFYKLTGIADTATGEVLANTDNSEGAAQGVGVGLFEFSGKVMKVNKSIRAGNNSVYVGLGLVRLTGKIPKEGTLQSALTVQVERL